MAKNTNKTVETKASVKEYIAGIKDEKRKKDFSALVKLYEKMTGMKPKMWGPAIVGYGTYHYKYDSGREGDAPLAAVSARAGSIVLYLSDLKQKTDLVAKMGKVKVSGGCVHVKQLEDIDTKILEKLVLHSMDHTRKKYS